MMLLPNLGIGGEISNLAIALARVLAGNAFGFGTLSLVMISKKSDRQAGLIALTVFHSAVAIAQAVNLLDGIVPFPVVIVHSVFALLFMFFSVKRYE